MTDYTQRLERIKERLREAEERRKAEGLPVRFYQVRCDAPECFRSEQSMTIPHLAANTQGWFIGADDGEPNGCPEHAAWALREVR